MKAIVQMVAVGLVLLAAVATRADQPTQIYDNLENLNGQIAGSIANGDDINPAVLESFTSNIRGQFDGLEEYAAEARKKGDALFFLVRSKTFLINAKNNAFLPKTVDGLTIDWPADSTKQAAMKMIFANKDMVEVFVITKRCSFRQTAQNILGTARDKFGAEISEAIQYYKDKAGQIDACIGGKTDNDEYVMTKYREKSSSDIKGAKKKGTKTSNQKATTQNGNCVRVVLYVVS